MTPSSQETSQSTKKEPQSDQTQRSERDRMVEQDDLPKELPTPPDGGWGWAVVFASFMIHVLADGFTYTFGIFFVELLNYYRVSEASASWVASILVGVTLGSGPISGSLVNKFGCRIVTIAGAILATISLLLSPFAPNIMTLYLTIGVGAGLGFGLMYLPAIVCVTSYFEKRRSFATGIAVCGSGIGTFAMSPLIDYMVRELSWKNAIIILAGLVLNCVVFGALFRPLEDNPPVKNRRKKDENDIPIYADAINMEAPRIQIYNDGGEVKRIQSDVNLKIQSKPNDDFQKINSQGNLNPTLMNLKNQETNRMTVSQPLLQAPEKENNVYDFGSQSIAVNSRSRTSLPMSRSGSGLLYRKDIFYRGSLLNIPEYKQNPDGYRASICRLPADEELHKEEDTYKVCGCLPCNKETRDALYSLLDWDLLSNEIFILFSVSNFCTSIGFNAPYIFIKHRAEQNGIDPKQASFLLSIVGIANTVSRIVLGYISDHPKVNRLYLYNAALTTCGVATCASIFMSDYESSCVYAAIFGATSGAYVGLTSVVLVDLLGMEKLTNAFGWLLLFQGIASLIGPPLCGSLYKMTDTYDGSFLLAGFMIAISGLMLFFIPCIWKVQAKRLAKKCNTSNQI